jgi:biopolymer transport protein ExbD
MRRRKNNRFRQFVEADLEILPLMNLFVVLIPMLLLSAVFLEIAVIRMDLPQEQALLDPPEEGLDLAVRIESGHYVIEGRRLERSEIQRTPAGAGGDDGGQERSEQDRAILTGALREIAAAHPDNRAVRIVSHPATQYEEIIAVMDASRDAGMPQISLQSAGD